MKSPISATIAIATGVIVLLGYFLPIPILQQMRGILLSWAIIVAAVAAWVGVANLLSTHWKKISSRQPDAPYSAVMIVAFLLTFIFGIAENLLQPASHQFQQTVNSIEVPIEASLMAILSISLIYAAVRLMRWRRDWFSVLFLISAIVFLILGSGLAANLNIPIVTALAAALNRLPLAGGRGILIGVALGSLTTGLRILIGSDRPYGG
jgi:hypothetical protein